MGTLGYKPFQNDEALDNITDKCIKYSRCIDKKYKNKKLQECLILSSNGKSGWISVDELKYAMRYHGLKVDNLKLTSDNRLITLKK